jgi:hypothetical protein
MGADIEPAGAPPDRIPGWASRAYSGAGIDSAIRTGMVSGIANRTL